jgi:cell division protein YceG involved in septum cleavage
MVQAEAANTKEMPQIAEVIYNRLSDGIPLGIDATIRYGLNNWTEPLTNSELATDSPYNTRLVAGLPPTPIGNPGLAAIEAAAKPTQGNLLYFVVKPGTCGHAFFDNEADFNAAVAEYNTAREAAGGKSPDTC